MSVLDKRFSEQQVRGFTIKIHNVLSQDNVLKLYSSMEQSKSTPYSYQCRMIFNLALITAMRPTELFRLQISQFKLFRQGECAVWRIEGRIGSVDGTDKTMKGGFLVHECETKTSLPLG